MKVAKAKSIDRQSIIFEKDKLLETTGAKRSWVGDFFEEATSQITGATRLKTDSKSEICPDLKFGLDTYFEVKGIGKSGQGILYQNRVEKDERFRATGIRQVYFFWRHTFSVMEANSICDLRAGLAASTIELCLIDPIALSMLLANRPLRRINSRYMKTGKTNGYGSDGYGIGWSFPLNEVKSLCRLMTIACGSAYGQHFAANVYVSSDSLLMFLGKNRRSVYA